MSRKLVILLACLITVPLFGLATPWNIYQRPNSQWWSGSNSDTGWMWMKSIDELMASVGSNTATGRAYYVDSNVSNEGDGTSWLNAKNTLDEAVALCSANNGDVIYIAPGHTESMGTGADVVDLDVAGITVIGLGNGAGRPTFDYTDYDTGSFAIGNDNITVVNCRFLANVTDCNDAIEIEAGSENITIAGCWFGVNSAGTDEFHEVINSGAAGNHYLHVIGCEFAMGAGGSRCAIEFLDSDYAIISDNIFAGDYAVADVNNATTASDHIVIKDNVIYNGTIGGAAGLNTVPCIVLVATTSGVIVNNALITNVANPDAAITGADMFFVNNWYSETEGGVSTAPMWFTSDTTDNLIGYNDNDNAAVTNTVVANADGSILERLEYIQVDTEAQDTAAEMAALVDPNYVMYDMPRILIDTTSDMNAANGYTAAADPVIFTVTGSILAKVYAEVDTSCTSTSNDTLELGVTGDTACLLVQDAVDGAAFQQNDCWTLTQAADTPSAENDGEWVIIPNGLDIKLFIDDHDMTAGVITFYLQWIPLSPDAAVTGAAP